MMIDNDQLTEEDQDQDVVDNGHETNSSQNEIEIGNKHPSEYLDKLDFLKNVELLTHESLEKIQQQAVTVTRRRRANPNPKYNSSTGFLDPSIFFKKRSKDDEFGYAKSKKRASSEGQYSKNGNICFVCELSCEKLNFGCCKLTCGNCSTGFHSDCIRVGGSKAPLINHVEFCPNCIQQLQQKSRLKMDHSLDSKLNSLPLSPSKILNDMKSNIANKSPNYWKKSTMKKIKSFYSKSMPKLKSNLQSTDKSSKKRKNENRNLVTGENETGQSSSKSNRTVKRSPSEMGKSSPVSVFTFAQELTEADLKKTIISMTEAAKFVLENAKSNNLTSPSPVPTSTSTTINAAELLLSPSTTITRFNVQELQPNSNTKIEEKVTVLEAPEIPVCSTSITVSLDPVVQIQ